MELNGLLQYHSQAADLMSIQKLSVTVHNNFDPAPARALAERTSSTLHQVQVIKGNIKQELYSGLVYVVLA